MKRKWPIFAGIVLLTAGLLLAAFTPLALLPKVFIYLGIAFKVFYVIQQIVLGIYRPGYELALLLVGLTIFLSGLYLKKTGATFPYQALMFPGIVLKITFIILFILKVRKAGKAA